MTNTIWRTTTETFFCTSTNPDQPRESDVTALVRFNDLLKATGPLCGLGETQLDALASYWSAELGRPAAAVRAELRSGLGADLLAVAP